MKNRKAMLKSLLSLILCLSMFIGSTFAWFTDSVTSTGNIITSGTLDVGMYWTDDLNSGTWHNVEENGYNTIFNYDNWEPGYTDVKYIKLVNVGNLALNYKLTITPQNEVGKLAEVINVYFADEAVEVESAQDLSKLSSIGLLSNVLNGGATADGTILANGQTSPVHPTGEVIVTVAMNMITTAGNVYQGKDAGDFTITAIATQAPYEKDSFGSDYDGGAMLSELGIDRASVSVTPVDGKVPTGGVTLTGSNVSAYVPEGVVMENGADKLTLTVTPLENSQTGFTPVNNEVLIPVDVHIDGIAKDNTVPVVVNLGAILPKYLNMGNYRLYHVENDQNSVMTLVDNEAALTSHNTFTYDPLTGEVTVAMASFSEIALYANTTGAWEGEFDYSWYDKDATELYIANADQLAAFGAIVGGMNGKTRDPFAGKTVKLLADINLNHGTVLKDDNGEELGETIKTIFYPIGYYNSTGNNTGNRPTTVEGTVESTVYSFEGTFDGNGHTISNFYQNTWEMFGDYNSGYSGTPNYYKDAMGLFGYVYGGIIKNLTVHNFESDGEFTPTGVIAAYAAGDAIFENIAITKCNPRVYNTGNGGIIGIAGDTSIANDDHIKLKNITVDNSNKISALWGSYDVACGGLVGMYRGNVDGNGVATGDTINFDNCHVAAQMDVYNDVCGNYQYYWYRYSGMIIGSIRHNKTVGDYVQPDMTGITANGCTVHFGEWNNYYYCEFEKNGHPSYSGPDDYKFSRVDNSELVVENGKVTGCSHNHTDVENNRAIYLPFDQLFTGYGWGVKSQGLKELQGITILDIAEGDREESVEKFETKFKGDFLYRVGNGNAFEIGNLFEAIDGATIVDSGVWVSLNKIDENSNISGTFIANTADWTKGTIKFEGTGLVKITIQDYNFCKPTELIVEVVDAMNINTATGSLDGTDVVLLSNVKVSSKGTVNYRYCTVYGNGFTFDVKGGMNEYNSKQGHGIIITVDAVLDNMVIIGDVYDKYCVYTNQGEDYTAAIDATNTTIQNCHVYNCSTPIRANGVTVKNTTLHGGTVANMLISGGVNTLENVTTVNYNDGERGVIGFGIVISDGASETTKLVLKGTLKQHNFVSQSDASMIKDENASKLFAEMFDDKYSKYRFEKNGIRIVNTGILSMTDSFDENDITHTNNSGYEGTSISYQVLNTTYKGYLYTLKAAGNEVDNNYDQKNDNKVQSDYLPTFTFDLGTQMLAKDGDDDTRYMIGNENGIEVLYQNNESPITLDLTKLATATKHGHNLKVSVSYKDANGKDLGTDATVELTKNGLLVFTVTDNVFFDKDGNKMDKSVDVVFEVPVNVSVKEASIKNAEIKVNKTSINGDYNSSKYMTFNPLEAITITDYDASGTATTVTLNKNISSKTVEYANTSSGAWGGATITITYTDGRVLTVHLGTSTLNSPGSSNGGKTITIQSDGSIKTDGKVANSSATGGTWTINGYSFKGNNGSTVTNNTKVTVNFADESGCVTSDTLIMLADGKQKRIDEVTYSDNLLVWNFLEGKLDIVPAAIIFYHGDELYEVLTLKFEDGTSVKTINVHGFYDVNVNEFVFIDKNNVNRYLGHEFAKTNGENIETVKLIGYELSEEFTGSYSIQSAIHINFITEGMLSETVPPIEGWFDYFEIGEDMKYDEAKMQADIERYGLYDYSDFAEYVTYEQFIAFNGPYLKVLVGRGVLTFEQILQLIATYVK